MISIVYNYLCPKCNSRLWYRRELGTMVSREDSKVWAILRNKLFCEKCDFEVYEEIYLKEKVWEDGDPCIDASNLYFGNSEGNDDKLIDEIIKRNKIAAMRPKNNRKRYHCYCPNCNEYVETYFNFDMPRIVPLCKRCNSKCQWN